MLTDRPPRCFRRTYDIDSSAQNAEQTKTEKLENLKIMASMKIAAAPERLAGDSIELSPLTGKMVGVLVRSRDKKQTRYGEKSMSHVVVLTEGAKSPEDRLEGIMFQAYFQELKPGQWYVGIVEKQKSGRNDCWALNSEKLDKKKVAEFVKLLATVEVGDQQEQLL